MTSPNALEIINAVKRDVQHVDESDFPLEVFPVQMQEILLDWMRINGYKVDYAACAMLSAISTALGNTYRVRLIGDWHMNAALFMVFVGRPGMGKTPPLNAVLNPLVELDEARHEEYSKRKEEYDNARAALKGKKGENVEYKNDPNEPKLIKTILSDFTPEKLIQAHANNPRGVLIHGDEIIGVFNSANRYNNSQLIEQFLTAWSGGAIDVTRVSNPEPIHIKQPFIGIVGGIQTKRMPQLFKKGYLDNGLIDRILFVMPSAQEIKRWSVEDFFTLDNSDGLSAPSQRWEKILKKVIDLDYRKVRKEDGTEYVTSTILKLDREAAEHFVDWWNSFVDKNNKIKNDSMVKSREMKFPTNVARLALIIQVARYACGESHLQYIDAKSVDAAVRLNEYFEESLDRVMVAMATDPEIQQGQTETFYDLLPESFAMADIRYLDQTFRVTGRTIENWVKKLVKEGKLSKTARGSYEKIVDDVHPMDNVATAPETEEIDNNTE